jgi:hypothetical protein
MRVAIQESVDKADGVVFRCTLSGSAADRWLEVPAWMFDRARSAVRLDDRPADRQSRRNLSMSGPNQYITSINLRRIAVWPRLN